MGLYDEAKRRDEEETKRAIHRAHKQSLERSRQQQQDNRKVSGGGGACFVATAAFGNYHAPEVVYLSAFRDQTLNHSPLGRAFVRSYYKISPTFAAIIAKSTVLRLVVRALVLRPVIFLLRSFRA